MRKCVLALSGGMDSTALMHHCIAKYGAGNVHVVNFHYGSKHNYFECNAARNIVKGVPLASARSIDISKAVKDCDLNSNLLESGGTIPLGHYSAPTMKLTVVPGRNTIFASFLLGIAQSITCDESGGADIALGIHAGDHAIYPDCRPQWALSFQKVCEHASEGMVGLWAPFLGMSKGDIIRASNSAGLDVPWHLTRTCYQNSDIACGKCGSCVERLEAFAENNMRDPIEYSEDGA